MSKYTTELRFICEQYAGCTESQDNSSVNVVISLALPKLFNFDFPIFDEQYRSTLETKIVRHFYTREIGYETVGRWKMALENKLNEIMPYYNKLYESELLEFNPLYTHDMKTKQDDKLVKGSTVADRETHAITLEDEHSDTVSGTGYNLVSDTPQGGLSGLDDMTYMSNAQKNTEDSTNTGSYTRTDNGNSSNDRTINSTDIDDYLQHIYGYANYSPSKLLEEYRETFLNIDMLVIKDLEKLFMLIW